MSRESLFSPLQLGALQLPNRIIMAPLTRMRAGANSAPTALNAKYYAQRASAGLIISEGTAVSPDAHGYPSDPEIYTAEQIERGNVNGSGCFDSAGLLCGRSCWRRSGTCPISWRDATRLSV